MTTYEEQAMTILNHEWSYVYNNLLKCSTEETFREWYIDERAHAKDFFNLLALANPTLFKKVRGKKVRVSHICAAIKYIFEHNKKVEYTID